MAEEAKNMYRVEIISNQSVENEIVELLEQELPEIQYTLLTDCNGKGLRTKKLGNTIWPEKNFLLFAYVDLDSARKIKAIVLAVKEKFPAEGISLFFTRCEEI